MKRLPTIATLLILPIVVYFGVDAAYKMLLSRLEVGNGPGRAAMTDAPASNAVKQRPLSDYRAISERDLFRTGEVEEAPPPPPKIENLKKTDLKLKLWGTAIGGEGEEGESFAVIEDRKKRKQGLYRTGDSIHEATLTRILKDKVVINVDGEDQILEMATERLPSAMISASAPSTRVSPPSTPPDSPSPGAFTVSKTELDAQAGNLNEILKNMTIRPYIREGRPEGIALLNMKQDSVFSQMGFKNGDIITGVNGKYIESVSEALNFYKRLKSSSRVAVNVLREGRDETIEYVIE